MPVDIHTTQPASIKTLRACSRFGHCLDRAEAGSGTLFFSACGNRGRTRCPSFIAGLNSGEVSPSFNAVRNTVNDQLIATYKAGEPKRDPVMLIPRDAS